MATTKVAVVTGGASGIGFAVARDLLEHGWVVHILYHSSTYNTAQSLRNAHLEQADVTSWESLSAAFEAVFQKSHRLDFVFANAGVLSEVEFFADPTGNTIAPIDTSPIDVNLRGVIFTSQLACHYFRRSPGRGEGATLLINASSSSFYAAGLVPVYGASKAGVLHFMRSIAEPLFRSYGIKAHAICPGPVHTTLASPGAWAAFPVNHFIPVSDVVGVLRRLLDDKPFTDSAGKHVAPASKFGLAVEVGTAGFYFRDIQVFSDPVAQSSLAMLSVIEKDALEYERKLPVTKSG